MAYIDNDGLIWAEPQKGDVLRIAHVLRPDYGPLRLPAPALISNHTTARWMPDGQTTFPLGMVEIGARVKKRPNYAGIYVFRDGEAVQTVKYGRSCIATEGAVIINGKRYETNRVAFQIEWDNWGACDRKGFRGEEAPTVNPKRKDAVPNNPNEYPGNYWQNVTETQARAVAEICAAVVEKSGMRPEDAFHGHYELARKQHIDPGPQVINFLEMVVAPFLGLPLTFRAPARNITGPLPVVISRAEVA
jgi:hypothetical protein